MGIDKPFLSQDCECAENDRLKKKLQQKIHQVRDYSDMSTHILIMVLFVQKLENRSRTVAGNGFMGKMLAKHLKKRIHFLKAKLAALEQGEKKAAKKKRNYDASEAEERKEETVDEVVERGRRSHHQAEVHVILSFGAAHDKH